MRLNINIKLLIYDSALCSFFSSEITFIH
jgi:hypothetical protein